MKTIHRVLVKVDDIVELSIPGFIRTLKFAKVYEEDAGMVEMWYEVDLMAEPDGRKNVIIFAEGTGHDVTTRRVEYIETLIWKWDYTRLVFHFYVGTQ